MGCAAEERCLAVVLVCEVENELEIGNSREGVQVWPVELEHRWLFLDFDPTWT
jgi:hypothetical protein